MTAVSVESLSIGIVTYNHEEWLQGTLWSVLEHLPVGLSAHIWVLDNKSTDRTLSVAQSIASRDSRITVMENSRNEGFGRANNQILTQVQSTYHVMCNPDITLTVGALDRLIAYLRDNPKVGIVCPRVHFEDGRLQPLNRRHPSIWDLFLQRFMSGSLRPFFTKRMRRYVMLDVGYEQSYEVPFVSGAFMVCRTDVLKAVGGFDERYFLYLEDADLSRTVQRRGWRTLYCPDALVLHGWQRASHRTCRGMFLFCASIVRYFNKWGWRWF